MLNACSIDTIELRIIRLVFWSFGFLVGCCMLRGRERGGAHAVVINENISLLNSDVHSLHMCVTLRCAAATPDQLGQLRGEPNET